MSPKACEMQRHNMPQLKLAKVLFFQDSARSFNFCWAYGLGLKRLDNLHRSDPLNNNAENLDQPKARHALTI